jgi:MFS family permease
MLHKETSISAHATNGAAGEIGDGDGFRLWSFEFSALCAINVLAFCNLAIFYGFYSYLAEIGIPPHWRGPLLAMGPFTSLLARPFLGRVLTLGNGVRFMRLGLCLATVALLSYPFATTIPALVVVRVLHGAGYVTLVGGLMGILTVFLPREKSAQGFGIYSITMLVPNALMPPFVEFLLPHLPGPGVVYAVAAPLMLPAFLLLIPLGRKTRALAAKLPQAEGQRPDWTEVRQGLAAPGVLALAAANLFFLVAFSLVFFFMRDFAAGIGAGNPGVFFTIVNLSIIAVRLLFGEALNHVNQGRVLFLAFVGLALLVPLFGLAGGPALLWVMAVGYGTGIALTMPLINAGMLTISPPRLRAFNANLLMLAVDAGFLLGPILGGALTATHWTRAELFILAGIFLALAAGCVLPAIRLMRRPRLMT